MSRHCKHGPIADMCAHEECNQPTRPLPSSAVVLRCCPKCGQAPYLRWSKTCIEPDWFYVWIQCPLPCIMHHSAGACELKTAKRDARELWNGLPQNK